MGSSGQTCNPETLGYFILVCYFILFEMWSHYTAQAGLILTVLLPWPPACCNNRHGAAHLVTLWYLIINFKSSSLRIPNTYNVFYHIPFSQPLPDPCLSHPFPIQLWVFFSPSLHSTYTVPKFLSVWPSTGAWSTYKGFPLKEKRLFLSQQAVNYILQLGVGLPAHHPLHVGLLCGFSLCRSCEFVCVSAV